ncbi:MAG: hypothetical protein KJZ54_00165 [Phycisphaerales bacterium]|nr:hypothetical protein [Phycisphaerales bacterium]
MNRRRRTIRSIAGSTLVGVVMLTIMVAGIAKLVELDRFALALETWTIVPSPLRMGAVLITPIVELAVGLGWLLAIGPRRAWRLCAGGLLALYTVLIGVQTAVASPPDCDCLGLLLRHTEWMRSAEAALIRNALLLILLLLGGVLAASRDDKPWERRSMQSTETAT